MTDQLVFCVHFAEWLIYDISMHRQFMNLSAFQYDVSPPIVNSFPMESGKKTDRRKEEIDQKLF